MGKPIPYAVRVKIIEKHLSGATSSTIAQNYGYSLSGIKKIIKLYRSKGKDALKADYSKCGKSSRQHFSDEVEKEILRRKVGLPGAGYVHSVMYEQLTGERIPSSRTIQRRWCKAGRVGKSKIKNQGPNSWTKEVHHTWQIDGKEQIELGNGQQVSWVNIADEASSAVLYTQIFPPE